MADKFKRRDGDLKWGRYDYPVTPTQKKSLDGITYILGFRPEYARKVGPGPGYFYSQNPKTGAVIIGQRHRSVNVNRDGRITSNQGESHSM